MIYGRIVHFVYNTASIYYNIAFRNRNLKITFETNLHSVKTIPYTPNTYM